MGRIEDTEGGSGKYTLAEGSSPSASSGVEEESHTPDGEYSHTPGPGPLSAMHVGRVHESRMGHPHLSLPGGHREGDV